MSTEQIFSEFDSVDGRLLPRRRVLQSGEVWWVPGAAHYHVEPIPQGAEYEKIVDRAVFGTEAEARAAGVSTPCSRCAQMLQLDRLALEQIAE
jgi:hypothetical protein